MGYEIAGGLGVKLAHPERDMFVILMLNSELAAAVTLDRTLAVLILDNPSYGCLIRLQNTTGGASFNNLLADTLHETLPEIDFTMHTRNHVFVIDTDPMILTNARRHWWEVAMPEVSVRPTVTAAHERYVTAVAKRDAVV